MYSFFDHCITVEKINKTDLPQLKLTRIGLDVSAKELSTSSGSDLAESLPTTKLKMNQDTENEIKVEPYDGNQSADDSVCAAEREFLLCQELEVVSDSLVNPEPESVSSVNAAHQLLRRHEVGRTRKPQFECTVCFKRFIVRGKFNNHMLAHANEKKFGKRFARMNKLKPHKRRGFVFEPGFLCKFCGKQFKYEKRLQLHEAWCQKVSNSVLQCENSSGQLQNKISQGGLEQVRCPFCKTFYLSTNLSKHLETHNYNPDFDCIMCKKTCKGKTELHFHLLSHIHERPWFCRYCDASFMTRGALKGHEKTHTGYKPFKCSVCLKGFMWQGKLNVHMRNHTGEKPYLCNNCGMRFARLDKLKRHHARIHQSD